MAATPFTTYSELLAHLLDCYRNHSFGKASATMAGGYTVTWSSASELREAIADARDRAGSESGDISYRLRLKDGGRG